MTDLVRISFLISNLLLKSSRLTHLTEMSETDPPNPVRPRLAPLMPIALSLVIGIVLDRFVIPIGTAFWLTIAVGFAAAELATRGRGRLGIGAILVAYMALGGGWHHTCWSVLKEDDLTRGASETPAPAWVRGVIADVLGFRAGEHPEDRGYTRAFVEIESVYDSTTGDWRPVSGRAALGIVGDRSDLRAGDSVETAGNLSLVAGPLNAGEFDYRAYLRAQGCRLKLAVDDPKGVSRSEGSTASSQAFTRFIPRLIVCNG